MGQSSMGISVILKGGYLDQPNKDLDKKNRYCYKI